MRRLLLAALMTLWCGSTLALQPTHIGVFKVQPNVPNPELSQQQVESRARVIEKYYRTLARHAWDVQVTGYVVRADCNTNAPIYCKGEVAAYLKANDPEAVYNNYHVWGGSHGYCGLGDVGGKWSAAYIRQGCPGYRTSLHELGHNFGSRHSGIEDSDPYSDKTSIMGGFTSEVTFPVAPLIYRMGLEKGIEVVTESKEVIVPTLETLHLVKTGKFYLSLRKTIGHPYAVRGSSSTLYIHYDKAGQSTRLAQNMQIGDTHQLGNTKLEYLEYKDERARVAITIDNVEPDSTIMPDYLDKQAPLTSEHSGGWYDRDFNGQGFDVQIKGDRAAIYWYTFNQKVSSPRFYLGVCDIADCRFDLYTTDGGEHKTGTAQLYPEGGKLIFKYNTDEHGVGTIENELIARGEVLGSFYDPKNPGEGFSMQTFDGTMVAYWYISKPSQKWYMCTGPAVDGVYQLKVYEVQGGKWMQLDKTNVVEVDTATMTPVGDKWLFESTKRSIPLTLLF